MMICPYLNYDGDAEQAFRFYQKVLGGELSEVHRFDGMPGHELPPELAQRVMHVGLQLPGGMQLMASDTLPGMGPPRVVGTNYAISVHPSSREEAERFFAGLGEGGQVTMPLEDQFWGDYYGSVVDAFGVHWMINYNEATAG